MSLFDVCALLVAGFAASAVNAVAGGGSLITFPTLLAIGLPPISANVTNALAVAPGYFASVYGSRTDLVAVADRRGRGELLRLLPTAVVGTAIGCTLLLATPARAFELIVPFLILGAAAALAFQQRLRSLVGHPHDMSARRQRLALHAVVGLGALYGGYFNAGLGVMLVALLALVLDETLAHVTALKNATSAVVGVGTVVVYSIFGPVNWAAVAVLIPATALGGYAGARLARRLPAATLRIAIVTVGVVVGVILLWRAL